MIREELNAIDAQEERYNESRNSLNDNVLDQPWTLSDLLMKEEGLDTMEAIEDRISTSVIVDIESPQGESEAKEPEENPQNKPKITDCTMNSQQQIGSQQVAATDDNCSISIIIDNEKNYEDSNDDINEKMMQERVAVSTNAFIQLACSILLHFA